MRRTESGRSAPARRPVTSWLRRAAATSIVVLAAFMAVPALAQSTGGSFGGGSFGGGGGGGGGSSFRSGSRGGPTSAASKLAGLCVLSFVGLLLFGQSLRVARKRRVAAQEWAASDVDLVYLRLAVDARMQLKATVENLAKSSPMTDDATKLRHAVLALRGAETAWLYAEIASLRPATGGAAQEAFERLVANTRAASILPKPRMPDEARLTVMTLIVASKQTLPDGSGGTLAGRVQALLRALSSTAGSPHAVEIVWSPRFKQDHFSTTELLHRFPAIERLEEGIAIPRRFCHQCAWPHATELAQCPQCGAAAPAPA